MPKLGARWILPVLLTALFVFWVVSEGHEYKWQGVAENEMPISDYQPPTPLSLKLALTANLPALIPAAGTIALAHSLGIRTATADSVAVPVFAVWVAVFWFFCGRWIDRRLGLLSGGKPFRAIVYWPLVSFCFLGVILALMPKMYSLEFRDWAIGGWSVLIAICASYSFWRPSMTQELHVRRELPADGSRPSE